MNSLWDCVVQQGAARGGEFHGRDSSVLLKELHESSTLGARLGQLRRRSVLIATREQLASAVALLELDGVARRLVLCTPDLNAEQLTNVAKTASPEHRAA